MFWITKQQLESIKSMRNKMNKLKKILLEEGTTLIPFGFAFDKINKYWCVQKKYKDTTFFEKVNMIRRGGLNFLIFGAISLMALLYPIGSLSTGTLNYTKWPEIQKQKELQEEQRVRDYSEKQFFKADKNGDLVIDANEFYDYTHRRRKV